MSGPRMRISATVLDTPDPRGLSRFYMTLLGWELVHEDTTWAKIQPPGGGTGLSFQVEPHYSPPVWPTSPDEPQMKMHLDIAVADLDDGVRWATQAGATLADWQPQSDVRVMLDPDGHPFCLFAGAI